MDYLRVGMAILLLIIWAMIFIFTGQEVEWGSDSSKKLATGAWILSIIMLLPVGYFAYVLFKNNMFASATISSTIGSALGSLSF